MCDFSNPGVSSLYLDMTAVYNRKLSPRIGLQADVTELNTEIKSWNQIATIEQKYTLHNALLNREQRFASYVS